MGLDVRTVSDACCIASGLNTSNVALDNIEIDHHGRRSELTRNLLFQTLDAHLQLQLQRTDLLWVRRLNERMEASAQPSDDSSSLALTQRTAGWPTVSANNSSRKLHAAAS